MKTITCLFVLLCTSFSLCAQDTTSFKTIIATRIAEPIKIDAVLSEASWENAKATIGLVTNQPTFGQQPAQPTDIKMIYDDGAVYVSAMLYDSAPDSIPVELRERDQIGNADWFGVFFSPYQDGINGNGFIVTSAGVQFDAQYTTFGEDENWDAVWESQVQIVENGWVVEMRIPYSMLRFPKRDIQQWDINFGRSIRRLGEKSFWSPIDPQQDGFLNQFGLVKGIKDIDSPVRLSATPFVVGYAQHSSDETSGGWGQSFNAGMDIKYGINDAFTLDMTLIPDFGEARSDNQILNLGPFEQRFDENRQFFTEGVELFNKGGLFYSRRIGGRIFDRVHQGELSDGETIINNPQKAQLLNASKVSGRTKSGLGIGVFNAIESKSFATIENTVTGEQREVETHPLTNYNVLALDQNLKNNSFVTFINTNVTRFGEAYDANVMGTVFELRNKENSYSVSGQGSVSQILESESKVDLGHAYRINAGKTNGNWQWRVGYNEESDNYNINDLGFLFNNNERGVWGNLRYSRYEPLGPFNSMGGGIYAHHQRLYNPNVATENGFNGWWWGQTKNLWNWNVFNYTTIGDMYDYFGPRTTGRFYRHPGISNTGFFVSSDRRKSLFFSVNGGHRAVREKDRFNNWIGADVTYRMSDRLSFGVGTYNDLEYNDVDFATFSNGQPIYGQRDVRTLINNIDLKFTPNTQMNFTFRLRHYLSKVEYHQYYNLLPNGGVSPITTNFNLNTTFDAFNIDAIYKWRFAPGSDIFVVWKNSIFDSQSSFATTNYFSHVGNLLTSSQTNSLSVKVIYFLDYLDVKNKLLK
ncbi:MAG: DUF5916 domain-containing protein [Bacteroidota bacterium]